jgi:3-oxoacyl-[acyl-carrier-protein] synthase III
VGGPQREQSLKSTVSRILALGSCFPETVVSNLDLEKIVDTSDQWIRKRTGIQSRHILSPTENNSDLAVGAARRAIEAAGLTPEKIGLIICCTNTPDRWMPSLAATVQAKLGIQKETASWDLISACAGWVAGLQVADGMIRSGHHQYVLVIGSEALTRFVNWDDRATCVLFGDGAGAAVVGPGNPGDPGEILAVKVHSDGRFGDILDMPAGGSRMPLSPEVIAEKKNFIHMNGQEVYKHAVRSMTAICEEILRENSLSIDDVQWLVPHQANLRIIEAVGKQLGIAMEKVALNVHKYGNTSTATIPTCMDEYVREKKIKSGDLVLLTTFGGGLTWAGALVKW